MRGLSFFESPNYKVQLSAVWSFSMFSLSAAREDARSRSVPPLSPGGTPLPVPKPSNWITFSLLFRLKYKNITELASVE